MKNKPSVGSMSQDSVSALEMKGIVIGKGIFVGRLHKHLSPVTIGRIQRALPLNGRINTYEKNFLYILTTVVTGEEKARKEFKSGEIAFMPGGCMLCFFLQDTRSYKPMNLLGEVVEGFALLQSCKRGDGIEIKTIASLSG